MGKKKAYKRRDHLYKKAKHEGHASRAIYKLEELNKRYRIFKRGQVVLDLGCAPGGWSEYASRMVGKDGLVIGVDTQDISIERDKFIFIQGDVFDDKIIEECLKRAEGEFDLILSDMSPKLTGIKEADNMRVVEMCERALEIADSALQTGGVLVLKAFKSQEAEEFFRSQLKPNFDKIYRVELRTSRASSNEFYFLAKGKR